ncbi:hypothetical protein B9Z55_007231 [Caenorhabditis nigoni]|nr:hypothetical protein B9Z55_007231 [Caenorhabditis nigoni]
MGLKTLSSSAVSSNSKTSENSKSKSDDPKSKRAKRSASEIDVNRQSLLEFAFATRSLELIKKIGHMKMDFETVYREGAHVVGMISNITNLEKRKMMEDAWKDFTVIKKDLETFRIKNIRSVNAIWGPPEKTLVDIGRVYKSILVFTFFKQEEVRKMRDSLRYLDIPNIELEKALDNLEELLFMDWGLVYTNFQKISSILPGLQKEFSEFFAPPDDDKEDDFGMKIIMYIGIVFGTLIVLALVVFSVVMCVLVSDPDEKLPPPKEPVYTVLQVHQLEHTYMQLQDARLDINKIDKNGDTPIYQAIRKGDFAAVEDLLNKGAILDASCNGAQCRTALFELVLKKKETLISKFLKAGANPNISNANGDSVVKFAGKYGMSELFQNRYERKQYELPRILPKVPRYWKVLVMNHRCVKLLYKRFLPRRIKNHITWGYKEGMDLDSFSHIVVPDNLLYDDVTLKLDDENLLAFRLLGCWANLMSVEWFKALADKKIHENAMNSDCRYFLRNVEYRGTLNYDTILKQKNSIHQLRPGLLTNTVITILPTKNDRRNKQREEIQKLIEQFGGEYSTEVILAGQEMREMPYYAVDIDNLAVQNRIWILKYSDSDYGSKWQESPMLVTLSDIQLLFECIARWELLHFENDIVKAVYNKRALRR